MTITIHTNLARRAVTESQWKSDEGQSLVELALVLPLLLLLLFAAIDFSMLFFEYHCMEYGVTQATRYGLTGQQMPDPNNPGNNLSQQDSMKLIMRQCNPIVLSDSAFNFQYLNGTVWTTWTTGGSGYTIRMTVTYNWKPITPFMGAFFSGGQIPLQVASTVKNESF